MPKNARGVNKDLNLITAVDLRETGVSSNAKKKSCWHHRIQRRGLSIDF
jgi:hypothetical protein